MPSFHHTIPVQAGSDRLWSLVRDVRRVAGLFPYVEINEFTQPAEDRWCFWRELRIPNTAQLRWQEEAHVVTEGELAFKAVAGDLRTFVGRWLVAPEGASSSLTLTVEYDIPEEHAPGIPGALVSYVMGEVFKSICQQVKAAAEAIA